MSREFDIIVVGGGHAGVEAALAAVRIGCSVAIVTMDPSKLALMSCNPAIGGIGKSQLVKEVDALGGLMGEAIDATGIQFRRLNLSRGPAVWSTRVQADRIAYNKYVVDYCKRYNNLELIEGTVDSLIVREKAISGVKVDSYGEISANAVIITTGTFLGAVIHIGKKMLSSGRMGDRAAGKLSESFRSLGFETGRLKTGTPPRLDGKTINWELCEPQKGEEPIPLFSYRSKARSLEQIDCHITRTTQATKDIISAHSHESPIFSGQINSTGPRYCPSIEDKFHRFSDKESHQLFLEPEGNGTDEVYPNGFSTALPESVQRKAIRTVIGLENALITQPGYAVEYDYCPACQIKPSLETKRIDGLYFAGQINGTSGYEEAAAQGLMAGINAAHQVLKLPPFILDRSESYIGVMIDDLTTRSTTEPYRMFTSRAEYRLSLREDNARDRLFGYAKKLGLISDEDFRAFAILDEQTGLVEEQLRQKRIRIADLGNHGARLRRREDITYADLLKQPNLSSQDSMAYLEALDWPEDIPSEALMRASIRIRYEGYIAKQEREMIKFKRMEKESIPDSFDWSTVLGLKNEAMEKFTRFRPTSLGQAGRIEGVSPGDLAVLSVYLKRHKELSR